jgi:ABC-2 type transport system ATP-binding protein
MPAIKVEALSKTYSAFNRREGVWGGVKDLFRRDYHTICAVDGISFSVEQGELVGYIGPNGAGKSTSIKMLTGILRPTSGKVDVLGYCPYRDRQRYTQHIGVVFGQRTQLWWDIAVQESFRLLGKIYRLSKQDYERRIGQLSEVLGLEDIMRIPVRKLSLGQRMRCDLAASLLHNPRIVFLDEPTIGLDSIAKDSIRTFLRFANREYGTTIILTTHDLREIEELCQRIMVIDKGRIVYDGTLAAVKALSGIRRSLIVDFVGEAPQKELIELFEHKLEFHVHGERRLLCEFDPAQMPPAEIIRALMARFNVADLSISEPSIEQVIMKIYREGIS